METERGRRPRQVWHAKRTGMSTSNKIGTGRNEMKNAFTNGITFISRTYVNSNWTIFQVFHLDLKILVCKGIYIAPTPL